jgi:hypothetical protein
MGVVYQAWDEESGIAVALKTIRPSPDADLEAVREREMRLKREFVLARQVTHRNVIEDGRRAIALWPSVLRFPSNYALDAMYAGDFPTAALTCRS